jgi:hypothetical protein
MLPLLSKYLNIPWYRRKYNFIWGHKNIKFGVISGFRRGANEIFDLLVFYAA